MILTGMGHDGLEGMKAIKAARGRTVAGRSVGVWNAEGDGQKQGVRRRSWH
ncbi:MAG: chemotaxis protein CheB [Nitrospiraceae bacterium]